MEATDDSSTPRFATAVRGYDRMQVDDYVEHLNQWIEQADNRAQQCEDAAARAAAEVEQMRRRLSSLDAESLTATPESMKALGQRVGAIMQSSFHAAADLHAQAEGDARATTTAAEEHAARIVTAATAGAEELSRAAEDLFVQAQETLAAASDAAAQQIEEARERAEAERADLVERARAEVQELARQSAAEETLRRERLALLDEHKAQVLEEVGMLHERLGSIGDGLAARAELGQPQPAPASSAHPDESTEVLELPAASRPSRRRVASSAR